MENKDILKARITSQLAKWKNAIANLTAKLEVAEEKAKIKLREQLDGLHDKRVQAEKKLEEISTTSQDAWESAKAGFEQGWAELTRTAKTAARKVRETFAHPDRDEEIRQIAYKLWQEEGCPDGRHLDHWFSAEAIWRVRPEAAQSDQQPRPKAKRTRKKTAPPAKTTSRATKPNPSPAEGIAREGPKSHSR
jgi:hypothetical protein